MNEQLLKIKEMLEHNKIEEAIIYIDTLITKADVNNYIDELILDLK